MFVSFNFQTSSLVSNVFVSFKYVYQFQTSVHCLSLIDLFCVSYISNTILIIIFQLNAKLVTLRSQLKTVRFTILKVKNKFKIIFISTEHLKMWYTWETLVLRIQQILRVLQLKRHYQPVELRLLQIVV